MNVQKFSTLRVNYDVKEMTFKTEMLLLNLGVKGNLIMYNLGSMRNKLIYCNHRERSSELPFYQYHNYASTQRTYILVSAFQIKII